MIDLSADLGGRLRKVKLLRALYRDSRFLAVAIKNGMTARLLRVRDSGKSQQALVWSTPTNIANLEELRSRARALGLVAAEGKFAIYFPPQPQLSRLFGEAATFYPNDAGFKILKALREGPDVQYVEDPSAIRRRLSGSLRDNLLAASFLHVHGLGPRIYDLTTLRFGEVSAMAYVVEHVEGGELPLEEARGALAAIDKLVGSGPLRITVPNWKQTGDFRLPACNGNLLAGPDGAPRYVDFQNFAVDECRWTRDAAGRSAATLHFGGGRAFRGSRYLYQAIPRVGRPGKRSTAHRWARLCQLFKEVNLSSTGRVVLDVGCNSGMMLQEALKDGALWGLGWDRPEVAPMASEILYSLGSTRFSITPAVLSEEYDLERDIPMHCRGRLSESVVFYLSVRQHFGMMDSLRSVPFRLLVYEGHQGEKLEELDRHLAPVLMGGGEIAAQTVMADGDSAGRPLAIVVRK